MTMITIKNLGKAYTVPSNVFIGDCLPTDFRSVCDSVNDFEDFIEEQKNLEGNTKKEYLDIRYEGLVTYDKTDGRLKVWNGSKWNDVISDTSGVTIEDTPISGVTTEYCKWNSETEVPTTSAVWQDTVPDAEEGMYIWMRIKIIFEGDVSPVYSNPPTCLGSLKGLKGDKGDKGDTGEQGEQGIPGTPGLKGEKGDSGQQFYTWLKYADTPTSGMSEEPTGKNYIGLAYNKTTQEESEVYSDYQWSYIRGDAGKDGVDGSKGEDGQQLYTWIKYSKYADGKLDGVTNMTDYPDESTIYIGLAYNKTTKEESDNADDYIWSLIKGDKGDPGDPGVSVNRIISQFYMHDSPDTKPGDNVKWLDTPPAWEYGKFLWIRNIVYYDNGSMDVLEPFCDSSWKAIEALSIGGRNILSFTGDLTKWSIEDKASITSSTSYSGYYEITNNSSTSSTRLGIYQRVEVFPNTDYVISAYGTDTFNMAIGLYNDSSENVWGDSVFDNEKDSLHKYVYQFNTGNNKYCIVYFYAKVGQPCFVMQPKLEKGTKNTDWTPDPNDFQIQLDNKIQTFYQDNDPSVDWSSTEKTVHAGDLWYKNDDSANAGLYRWTGTAWVKLADQEAAEAKKLAEKKAQIFTETPTPPYYVGDLWIQGEEGDILVAKVNSEGKFDETDWGLSSKYVDDGHIQQKLNDYDYTIGFGSDTNVKIEKLGITVKNSGIRIINKDNQDVLAADNLGNMTLSNITITGSLQPSDHILKMFDSSSDTYKSVLPDGTKNDVSCMIDAGSGALRLKRDFYHYIQLLSDGTFRFYSPMSAIKSDSDSWSSDDFLRIECIKNDSTTSKDDKHAFIGNSAVGIKFLSGANVAQIRYGLDSGYADLHLQNLKAVGDVSYGSLTANSSEKYKTNIDDISLDTCVDIVKNNDVKTYNLKYEIEDRLKKLGLENELDVDDIGYSGADPLVSKRVGLIVEDLTDTAKTYLVPESGDGIDPYSMISVLWKVVKSQQSDIEELKAELENIKKQ